MKKQVKKRQYKNQKKKNQGIKLNVLDYLFLTVGLITSVIAIFFDHEHSAIYIAISIITLNSAIIGTVLSIKGRRSNFIFSFINAITYGQVSWYNRFFGSAASNLLFYAPCAIAGFLYWGKHRRKNKEVIARKFTPPQAIIVAVLFILSTAALNFILKAVGGESTLLDSSANVLVVFASILAVLRFREQWLFWLIADLIQLVMWTTTSDPTILVLRIFFPISSIYGYINWRKLVKQSK